MAANSPSPADRPRLVCLPPDDAEFGAHARALLEGMSRAIPEDRALAEFEAELRRRYPGATVRPREPLADPGVPEVVWYVRHRPFRARIAAGLDIKAATERVFRIYVERFPEWQSALRVRPVRLLPELTGSEYVIAYQLLGRTLEGRLHIVAAEPPNLLRYEARGFGARVWYATKFRATPLGTRVDVTGDYELPEGAISRMADRLLIERLIQRDIDAAHERLRVLCEGPPGTVAGDPPS